MVANVGVRSAVTAEVATTDTDVGRVSEAATGIESLPLKGNSHMHSGSNVHPGCLLLESNASNAQLPSSMFVSAAGDDVLADTATFCGGEWEIRPLESQNCAWHIFEKCRSRDGLGVMCLVIHAKGSCLMVNASTRCATSGSCECDLSKQGSKSKHIGVKDMCTESRHRSMLQCCSTSRPV